MMYIIYIYKMYKIKSRIFCVAFLPVGWISDIQVFQIFPPLLWTWAGWVGGFCRWFHRQNVGNSGLAARAIKNYIMAEWIQHKIVWNCMKLYGIVAKYISLGEYRLFIYLIRLLSFSILIDFLARLAFRLWQMASMERINCAFISADDDDHQDGWI